MPHDSPIQHCHLPSPTFQAGQRYSWPAVPELVYVAPLPGDHGCLHHFHNPQNHSDQVLRLPRGDGSDPHSQCTAFKTAATCALGWAADGPPASLVRPVAMVWVQNLPGLLMDYIQGCSLDDLLVKRQNGDPHAIRLLGRPQDRCALYHDLAQALAFVHRRGVVHRGITLSAIRLDAKDGVAKLMDLGLAGPPEDLPTTYHPPERRAGLEGISQASDVYAFGVVLLQVESAWLPALPAAQLVGGTAWADLFARSCPVPALVDLIGACLNEDSARRPTAEDLLQPLETIAAGLGARLLRHKESPSPEPLIRLGYQKIAQDPAEAEILARRALTLAPNLADAQALLAAARYHRDDLEGAETAARRAVDLDPACHDAWDTLGEVLMRRKDLEGAKPCYQRACELAPNLPHYQDHLLGVDLRRAELRQSVDLTTLGRALDEAQATWPHDARFWKLRERLDKLRHRPEDTANALRQALATDWNGCAHVRLAHLYNGRPGMRGQARELLRRFLAHHPTCVDAWTALGSIAADAGDLKESMAAYSQARDLAPDDDDRQLDLLRIQARQDGRKSWPELRTRLETLEAQRIRGSGFWNKAGNIAAMAGDFAAAEDFYLRSHEQDPLDATVLGNLVWALGKQGRPREAQKRMEQWLTTHSRWANGYAYAQGSGAASQAGDAASAEVWLRRGIDDHEDSGCLIRLVVLTRDQGRLEESRRLARTWLEQPGHEEQAGVWNNMAISAERSGDLVTALSAYRRAVAIEPDNDTMFANMLDTLRACGKTEEAWELGLRFIDCHPHADLYLLLNLGLIGFAEDPAEAKAILLRGLAMAQPLIDDADSYAEDYLFNIVGLAELALGRHAAALEHLRAAAAGKPCDPVLAGNIFSCRCRMGQRVPALAEIHAWMERYPDFVNQDLRQKVEFWQRNR